MGGLQLWREPCSVCGRVWSLSDRKWLCSCGGLLDLVGPLADPFASGDSPLVRYGAALPPGAATVDLGMSVTPVAEVEPGLWVKAEQAHPTGSFKDRGAAVMIGVARELGVDSVVVDSSGNAGRSVAAHAARAAMVCTVYVPTGTSTEKMTAIGRSGATVVAVPGDRAAAAVAAQQDVISSGRWYASHVHQPLFHHGVKTLAFELFEQVPDLATGAVVVPVGNGTLVLGLWLGFGELVALGHLRRRPALVAVQAERCAPLIGWAAVGPGEAGGPTCATGIAIPSPPRAAQIRAAVLASGGTVVTVGEAAILAAQSELSALGLEVEPTGAVAWAAVRSPPRGAMVASGTPVVAVLTGG